MHNPAKALKKFAKICTNVSKFYTNFFKKEFHTFTNGKKKLVLEKAYRPTNSFFNKEEIVLLYLEKSSNHYYDIRGGIVINPSSQRGKQEALEIKILQIKTRIDSELYPERIPKLPFVRNYPHSSIKSAEKFANLVDLSEQISRLN